MKRTGLEPHTVLAQWSLEEHSSLPQQTRTLEVQKSLPESENAVVCVRISAVKSIPIVGSKSPWPVHPTVLTINPAHSLPWILSQWLTMAIPKP